MIAFAGPSYVTDHTFVYNYSFSVSEKDNEVIITGSLPGIDKKDVELTYHSDNKTFHIFVKDKIDRYIKIRYPIVEEEIEAELSLGILKVRAPILNSSRSIQIK